MKPDFMRKASCCLKLHGNMKSALLLGFLGLVVPMLTQGATINSASANPNQPPLGPLQHPVMCSGTINDYYNLRYGLKLDANFPEGVLTLTEDLDSKQGYPDVFSLRQLDKSIPDGHYTLMITGFVNSSSTCSAEQLASPPIYYCGAVNDLQKITATLVNNETGAQTSYDLSLIQLNEYSQSQSGIVDVTPMSSVVTVFIENREQTIFINTSISFPTDQLDDGFGCNFVN